MRIFKYLLLLLLLISIGLTVYIFTQKGDYQVTRSQIIKASRFTVFDYVNDYKNWETFHAMKQRLSDVTFNYKAQSSGKGGSFSWKSSDGDGFMKTVFVKENDSLAQKMTFGGNNAMVNWKFKDTIGGTKVTYTTKGTIGFMQKLHTFFEGGINRMMNNDIDRTLYNLNKTLDFELKTYSVKVNGVEQRKAAYFIKQTFSCKMKSLSRNIKIVMPKLVYFFKKNNITMAGKPFVIYETTTLKTDVVTVSVCIPTQQLVSMTDGSDVTSGEMEGFTCIKTTLKGDYSHRDALWKKAQDYVLEKNYQPNFAGKYIEYYSKTIDDVKNPSKWETELYIPVYPKAEDIPVTTSETDIPAASTTAQGSSTVVKPQVIPNATTSSGASITVPKKIVPRKTDSVKSNTSTPNPIPVKSAEEENE